MTPSSKILLTLLVLGAGTMAFWLWYRQCYAVPPEAVPIMQQARAVLATSSNTIPATVTSAASAQSATNALLQSVFPTDIPLPAPISVS